MVGRFAAGLSRTLGFLRVEALKLRRVELIRDGHVLLDGNRLSQVGQQVAQNVVRGRQVARDEAAVPDALSSRMYGGVGLNRLVR